MNGLGPPSAHQNGPVLICIEDHIGAPRPITDWPGKHKEKERGRERVLFCCYLPPSWLLMKSTRFILALDVYWCDTEGGGWSVLRWMDGMIPARRANKWEMDGSPPRHPGFGTTGKSFLIDNLLRPGRSPTAKSPTECPAPKESPPVRVQRPVGGVLGGPWSVRHVALDRQNFTQSKDVGVSQTHTGQSYLHSSNELCVCVSVYVGVVNFALLTVSCYNYNQIINCNTLQIVHHRMVVKKMPFEKYKQEIDRHMQSIYAKSRHAKSDCKCW